MIRKIRFWILRNIFSLDEKYLLVRAIEDRIELLKRTYINERWADKENIRADIEDYSKIIQIFYKGSF